MRRSTNPKDLYGVKKVPSYSVVPATSMIYEALGMWEGGDKYGPFNWRKHPVKASVYFDALDRHVKALAAGQWMDPKSKKPHAGHAKACIGIIIDAYETGNLIWDMPESPAVLRLLEQYDRTLQPQEVTSAAKSSRIANRRGAAAAARGGARAADCKAARRRR